MINCIYLHANLNENVFIRTEVLRIKWQSFPAQLTRELKQPDEEESFNYLHKLVSNDQDIYRRN